jgi:hypothetical protein
LTVDALDDPRSGRGLSEEILTMERGLLWTGEVSGAARPPERAVPLRRANLCGEELEAVRARRRRLRRGVRA